MAPNASGEDGVVPAIEEETLEKLVAPQAGPRTYKITWYRVAVFVYEHIAALYGLYLLITAASWPTVLFTCVTFYLSAIGSCAGSHRLWSHKSYKAKTPLQIFLMLCHCLSYQHTIFLWARDHRLHHKYSDTDGDPYNSSRGLIYSHIGWVCVDRHPEIRKRSKLIDMSDMFANPVVMFQKRNRFWINPTLAFIIPTLIPIYFWNESLSISYHVNIFRLILSLNGTFSINSLAHAFGTKPYDKGIAPSQNIVTTMLTLGEGFHNYHHSFPYDYKAGEFGSFLNFSTSFIDFCAWLGLAYDLKSVSEDVLTKRMTRTGDGSTDKYGILIGNKYSMQQEKVTEISGRSI